LTTVNISQSSIQQEMFARKTELDAYDKRISDHLATYGDAPCDYLTHQLRMSSYNRGGYDVLKRMFGDMSTTKEMTMAELEATLGHKVKVIK